jgi:hypothetical protein
MDNALSQGDTNAKKVQKRFKKRLTGIGQFARVALHTEQI